MTPDHISRARLITTYAYHHHFFDSAEREFRGYAMVEMQDAEAFAALSGGNWSNENAEMAVPPKLTKRWFQAGLLATDHCDFEGNLLSVSPQIAATYDKVLDHGMAVVMDPDLPVHTTPMEYNAPNRVRRVVAPDGSIIEQAYNDTGLVDNASANIAGNAATTTTFVSRIQHNAKGDREQIKYSNDVTTTFSYDPTASHLTSLTTVRDRNSFPTDFSLQALQYTYHLVGNITCISDNSQQTIYFRNTIVEPKCEYTYDSTYQLVEATGREHVGQNTGGNPTPPDGTDGSRTRVDHPGDGKAMARYPERYTHDTVSNITTLSHHDSDAAHSGWTRAYEYALPSSAEPGMGHISNPLSVTSIGSSRDVYTYDGTGNMTGMPTVLEMGWDWRDQLVSASRQAVADGSGTPERT